jgi:hypothetical protein
VVVPNWAVDKLLANPVKHFCLAEQWLFRFCRKENMLWVQHVPSLVRHIGRVSALDAVPNEPTPRRQRAWTGARHEGAVIEDCQAPLDAAVS